MEKSSIPSMHESPPTTEDPLSEHELQAEREAVRKLDYTILPIVTLFYFVSFIDRSNIGNARVAGLQRDLHMTDTQYQNCITALFVPYIISELPSNLLLRKIGPRVVLPTLVTVWGIFATMQGFVKSYTALVSLRVFLGLVEGPLAPGITLYLSGFYTRKELSFRIAIYLSMVSLAGAFSGLLAAAIENMNGIGGRPGWAWILILEGLFSALVGIISFFLLPSTPNDSKFLTEHQKELIMRRLERDRPFIRPVDVFSFKEVLRAASSLHVVIMSIIAFMAGMMAYGLAFFLPSIVNQLGFSATHTQLLTVGPFATAFVITLITSFLSDRYASRGIVLVPVYMLAVVGFALYLGAKRISTAYGALFLTTTGVYAGTPILAAWIANNSEPHYRRATSLALLAIIGNSGGILATWSFPTKEGPKFTKTTTINLIFSVLVVVGCLTNVAYLSWRNKVKKRPEARAKLLAHYASVEKAGDDGGLSAWTELGDRHPDFVYAL